MKDNEQNQLPLLTKREYFAAMALSGIASREKLDAYTWVSLSIHVADELIRQLENK